MLAEISSLGSYLNVNQLMLHILGTVHTQNIGIGNTFRINIGIPEVYYHIAYPEGYH